MSSEFDDGDRPEPKASVDPQAARHQLIDELLDRNRTMQARPLIGAALREQPDDLDMLYQAARADWIDDDLVQARQGLADVLARDPEHWPARVLMLAVLTEQGLLADAEALALDLLRTHPESPWLYAAYSRVMLRALHLEKASALADEALRRAPGSADALRMRALCDLVLGRRSLNGQAMKQLLAEYPEDQATLAVMVAALAHAGRHREALRCAKQMLMSNPGDAHWLRVTRELTAVTHWSMWPLRPLQRYGWGASIGLWMATVLVLRLLAVHAPAVAGPASWLMLSYCAYSWVWPPLFRKWVLRA